MSERADGARPVDLLVLDDHEIVRQGVMLLVQQNEWIGRCRGAESLDEACTLLAEFPPDVAIVDLSLKRENGLQAIQVLLHRCPGLPIVVLTMHADSLACHRALAHGALGFVAKDDAIDELAAALKAALAGQRYLSSAVRSTPLGGRAAAGDVTARVSAAMSQLTPREQQVLRLIGSGMSAAEIAAELGRSVKTVEAHRNNLREKLGLRHNRELLQFSVRWAQFDADPLPPDLGPADGVGGARTGKG